MSANLTPFTSAGGFSTVGNVTASNIILTGRITGTGASPAPILSGFDSVRAINFSASGNVTGNYFIGDGSQLTNINAGNISGSYGNSNVEAYLPTSNIIIAINSNVANTNSNVANLTNNLANTNSNVSNNTSNITTLQGNVVTLTSDLANTNSNVSTLEGNVANLTNDLANTNSNVSNNASNITTLQGNVANLTNDLANTNSNVSNNASNITTLQGNVVTLTTDLANTNSNVANLTTDLSNTNSNVANLTNDLANTNSNVANISNAVVSLSGNVYANANVEAYLPTSNVIISINSNIANTNSNVANISNAVTSLSGNVYANANVAAYLPTYTSNITADTISTTGNITIGASGYFIGNGSLLTGISGGLANLSGNLSGNITANGYYIQDLTELSVNGNVTANYYAGDGSQLTGLYANANVAAYLPTYTGNITADTISITGNIFGNAYSVALVSNATTGNIPTLSATGNLVDSGRVFDDTTITNNNYWSANQTSNYVVEQLLNVPTLPPVNIATTVNVTRSGLAAIDGVTPTANSYILVKNQNNNDNGVFLAQSGAWIRQAFINDAYANVTTQTTYANLNINNGIVNVLSGTVNRNLQFQITAQNPQATFGNSIVFVTATTKIPTASPNNRFVDISSGNDTNNNGSSAFPFATISRALTGAQFPLTITVGASGGSDTSVITWTSSTPNTLVDSEYGANDGGQTQLTGVQTFATGSTRNDFKGTTHSTGTSVPFVFQSGSAFRNHFEDVIVITTAATWITLPTNASNFITLDNMTIANFNPLVLPNLTTAFTINCVNQQLVMPISGPGNVSTIINILNSAEDMVRVGGDFLGTIVYNQAGWNGTLGSSVIPTGIITDQSTLTTVLSHISDTTYDGFYYITGFTPTTFRNGSIIGKQTVAGIGTSTWFARTPGSIPATLKNTQGTVYTTGALTTFSGLTTVGNVTTSVFGNITGNFFIGNGSLLTGIAGGGGTSIVNGTSNVSISTANGNITMSVANTANVVTVTANSMSVAGNILLSGNIVDAGPISIITAGNGNIALTPDGTGIVTVSTAVSAVGNIAGNFFIGNGSLLTGIAGGGGTSIANGTSNVAVVAANANVTVGVGGTGNVAVFANTGVFVTGAVSATGNVNAGNLISSGVISTTGSIRSAIIAADAVIGNIEGIFGNTANTNGARLRLTSLSGQSFIQTGNGAAGSAGLIVFAPYLDSTPRVSIDTRIGLVSATGNVFGNIISTDGFVSAIGNVIGNVFIGNGAGLTGVIASANAISNGTSNIAIVANANIIVGISSSNIAVFANTGMFVTGVVSATGNITGSNISTAGFVSATGNLFAGNVTATGNIISDGNQSIAGNITGGNILTSGFLSAAGNATLGNIFTAGFVSATGNVNAGNLNITGNIVDAGPISIITASNGNIALTPDGTGIVTVSTAVSSVGNITGGNILTTGQVSVAGNVTLGNLNISGNIIDSGPISIITAANGNISLSANGTGIVTVSSAMSVAGAISGIAASNGTTANAIGYIGMPQNIPGTPTYTLALSDQGRMIYSNGSSLSVTVPLNATVAFPVGTTMSLAQFGAGSISIIPVANVTIVLAGTTNSGTRTVGSNGIAALTQVSTNIWFVTGTGVS